MKLPVGASARGSGGRQGLEEARRQGLEDALCNIPNFQNKKENEFPFPKNENQQKLFLN